MPAAVVSDDEHVVVDIEIGARDRPQIELAERQHESKARRDLDAQRDDGIQVSGKVEPDLAG